MNSTFDGIEATAKRPRRFRSSSQRLAIFAASVIGASVVAVPLASPPASAVGTTVKVTAVVNQQTADNGPAAWSTKNVTAASQGASVLFSATVTGAISPATGSVSWALSGPTNPTCPTTPLVSGIATCLVLGVLSPSLSAQATYVPGNDAAATSAVDTLAINTPALAPFVSGTPTTPPFTECPSIGDAVRGCNDLLVLNPDGTATFLTDPKEPTLDAFDDTLVGILNNTGVALSNITLQSSNLSSGEGAANQGIFAFDGDGLCSISNTSQGNFALTWHVGGKQLSAAQTGCPYGPTGYEGPFTYFSNYSKANKYTTGTVNFTQQGGLPSGGSVFFSLENKVTNLTIFHPTTTVTTLSASTIVLGQSINDTATVTGNPVTGPPTGTASFSLCPGNVTCTSTTKGAINAGPITLSPSSSTASSANSGPMVPNVPGTWCFTGSYNGSSAYSPSGDSSANDECFTVTSPSPGLTTTPGGATAGSPTNDNATVTGNLTGGAPTGTVTFYECGPAASACDPTTGTKIGNAVNLPASSGVSVSVNSPNWTPTTPGSYCYAAQYTPSPGAKYGPLTSSPSSECFAVGTVSLSKSASPTGTVAPGQVITYTVDAVNSGGAPSGSVKVSDPVPSGTAYVAGSASCNGATGCTASQTAGTVSFTLASVPASTTDVLTFEVTVVEGATTTIQNTATFTGPNCTTNCSSNPVTNPVADLAVVKVSGAGSGSVTANETVTYTLDATNSGSAAATAVVTDQVPADTTYVAGSATCPNNSTAATCAATFDAGSKTVTWTLTNVPSGTTYALAFSVTVNAGTAGAVISNTGEWTGQGCVPDPAMTSCPTNTVTNNAVGPPNAFITDPAGATAGSPTSDSATLTGNAVDGSPGGTITFYECGPSAATCDATGNAIGTVNLTPGPADTASATSAPWTPAAPGTYCYAAVYTPSSSAKYLGANAFGSSECFSVGRVSLTKSAAPSGTVAPGQKITYTILAANSGTAASGAVSVTDAVPTGTTYVSGSASCNSAVGCTASESSGTVTFTISSIAASSSDTLTFAVTVNAGDTATITNTAGFTGQNCPTSPCLSNTPQNPVADLTVTKSVAPTGPVAPGNSVTYTLAATNTGSAAASASVTDAVPSGTTIVGGSALCPSNATAATCSVNVSSGVVTWTLTNVPAGTTYDLAFSVMINGGDANGTVITNVANWSGQGCIPASSATTCPTNPVSNTVGRVPLNGFTTTTNGGNGQLASDTAVVTGNATDGSPSGTISFYECGPGVLSCSPSGTSIGTITLTAGSGNTASATSNAWNPATQGSYCYATVYNPGSASPYVSANGPTECFTQGSI
jgi:uncharacterized repeat protein (TIGR01451 family)